MEIPIDSISDFAIFQGTLMNLESSAEVFRIILTPKSLEQDNRFEQDTDPEVWEFQPEYQQYVNIVGLSDTFDLDATIVFAPSSQNPAQMLAYLKTMFDNSTIYLRKVK